MKKIISLLLIGVMLFAFSPSFTGGPFSNMSTAVVAQAKGTIGLNYTQKTIFRGQIIQLKVNGTNQKVKWSSSNLKIAVVSKGGKVKGITAGKTNIWATVGGKKYRCTITVLSAFLYNNVSAVYYNMGTGKGVVGILKNYNKFPVKITMTVLYYKYGNLVGKSSDETYCLERGKRCALRAIGPYDSNFDDISYSKYKAFLRVEKCSPFIVPLSSYVRVQPVDTGNNVIAGVKNAGKKNIGSIQLAVVYFNEYGKCIGYDWHYADCEMPGSIDYLTFNYPYNSNYDTLYPASYKIYFISAYSYDWEL